MADRVHPGGSPPVSGEFSTASADKSSDALMKSTTSSEKPIPPPPGTYVIQVPKDQIYRHPPPENARRFQKLTRSKPRRSGCCRCLCWTLGLLFILILLIAIAAGVLYLIYRPKAPNYTVNDISIRGLNMTSSSPLSPKFDVTVRAENPNGKIGFYYLTGSSVQVFHSGVNLCNGGLPAFYQPSKNVTVFQTALKGSNVVLASSVKSTLLTEQSRGNVPFNLNIKVPVKIKVGSVKTWEITVRVKCDVTVDTLTADARILDKSCHYRVKLW